MAAMTELDPYTDLVAKLHAHDYEDLSLADRVQILDSLCQLALESDSIREHLETVLSEEAEIDDQKQKQFKENFKVHQTQHKKDKALVLKEARNAAAMQSQMQIEMKKSNDGSRESQRRPPHSVGPLQQTSVQAGLS